MDASGAIGTICDGRNPFVLTAWPAALYQDSLCWDAIDADGYLYRIMLDTDYYVLVVVRYLSKAIPVLEWQKRERNSELVWRGKIALLSGGSIIKDENIREILSMHLRWEFVENDADR